MIEPLRAGLLVFTRSRYYPSLRSIAGSPVAGRFLQPDSIVPDLANPQSMNRYSYVLNNPLRYTDPTGHCAFGAPCPGFIEDAASATSHFFNSTLPGTTRRWGYWGSGAARWGGRQTQSAFLWSWGAAAEPAQAAWSSGPAEAAREYAADKTKDVVTYAAISALNPGTLPQNSLALGISLGSFGDRRQGSFGFALYENCRGLCQLGPKVAFTPGFLGFARGHLEDPSFVHENQHAIQSLLMGPTYMPITQAFFASCGWSDPCMHTRSPLEVDAHRAGEEGHGLHLPGFLLP